MTVDMFVARKRNMRIDSVPDKSAAPQQCMAVVVVFIRSDHNLLVK